MKTRPTPSRHHGLLVLFTLAALIGCGPGAVGLGSGEDTSGTSSGETSLGETDVGETSVGETGDGDGDDPATGDGDGDPDPDPGDGDGEPGDGDGDGDGEPGDGDGEPTPDPSPIGANGLYFEGNDQRVTVHDFGALDAIDTGDFTFEAWVKLPPSGQTPHPTILSNREFGRNGGFLFGFHDNWGPTNHKIPFVQLGGQNFVAYDQPPDLLDDQWHHFAARRVGETLTYVIDGAVYELSHPAVDSSLASDHPLWLGGDHRNPGSSHLRGIIVEVRIWNVARTDAELEANHDQSLAGDEPGLVHYWRLDEGAGQVAQDSAGLAAGELGSTPDADANDPEWVPG